MLTPRRPSDRGPRPGLLAPSPGRGSSGDRRRLSSRGDHHGRRALALVAAILGLVLAAPAARGQQTFELTEADEWAAQEEPETGTAEAELHAIRTALAEEDHRRARDLASAWIKRRPSHPMLPEAHLLRGDALVGLRSFYEALFDYEIVVRRYPGNEAFLIALEREFEIARMFARGTKRKLWGLRIVPAKDDAEELLIRVQERLPGSQLAEKAGMELGDFYFRQGNMTLAAEAYELFTENYPRSRQIDKARRREIYANLAKFKGPEFDAAGLYEARGKLERLKAADPVTADAVGADGLLVAIDENDARKMLETARWYDRSGDPVSAAYVLERLEQEYPRSIASREALPLARSIVDRLPEARRLALVGLIEAWETRVTATGPRSPERPGEPIDARTLGTLEVDDGESIAGETDGEQPAAGSEEPR